MRIIPANIFYLPIFKTVGGDKGDRQIFFTILSSIEKSNSHLTPLALLVRNKNVGKSTQKYKNKKS